MVTQPPDKTHEANPENAGLFIADPEIVEACMASDTIHDLNEARPENVPSTWEDAALEIGIHRPRSALLWCCPQCGHFNVSEHYDTTINRTLNLGSFKAKLTVGKRQACSSCGGFGFRLHSENGSRVIARIDASKHKQRRNLQAVAEELNAQIDEGGEPTEHDANAAWFRMNKLLKQGKGRKWWGLPFRRWRDTMEKRRCA
jgi:hypothetical protein